MVVLMGEWNTWGQVPEGVLVFSDNGIDPVQWWLKLSKDEFLALSEAGGWFEKFSFDEVDPDSWASKFHRAVLPGLAVSDG